MIDFLKLKAMGHIFGHGYVQTHIASTNISVVTVAVVTATQVVTSDTCTIFDILRCLDTPGCRLPSPLPPPSVKACALVEAETRDMLRREIEQCRQVKVRNV